MKTRFLFPHSWRIAGYLFFVIDIVFAVVLKLLHPEGYSQEIGQTRAFAMILHTDINILLVIFGLLFIAFAKERIEDEQISQLRLDSLQWAVYVNYAVFIICVIFINGLNFLSVVAYSVVTPLVIFIIRFRWKMYLSNRSLKNS
jgi:uncharacterized membrane protein YidH (DUF202 family)